MHITLLTTGSRGNVQPVIVLALGLVQAGHLVAICALQKKAAEIGVKVRQHNGVQETIDIINNPALTPVNWSLPQEVKQKCAALYQSEASDATKPAPEAYYRLAREFHERKLDKNVVSWAYYTLEQQSSLTDEFKALLNLPRSTQDALKD